MQRFIPRDPFVSDKRAGYNWWISVCDGCRYKKSKTCDYCYYK